MELSLSADQTFDLSIAVGAFLALYYILYIDPLTGEFVGLALGTLAVLAGVARYVDPEQYVSQTLVGLAAVTLGGAAPATILTDTPAADWLVGSQPLPLALGWLLVVVILALVARRSLQSVFVSSDRATA